jgi:hypothetical protein
MYKRLPVIFLLLIVPLLGIAQLQLYVSANGNDANDGTINKPFTTISKALRQVRELRRLNDAAIKNGAHIILREGIYNLYEPIFIRPEDAGTSESPTVIESANNERAIISGGIQIKNWKKLNDHVDGLSPTIASKIWVADIDEDIDFRQLWVNNIKAIRAKDAHGENMSRILSWNKKEETCFIPTPKFSSLQNIVGAEMFIHQWWAIAVLRIKKFEVHGDSTKLYFKQPESKIQSEHPWPAPWINKETGNSAFYLTNAIQFLDEEGEWFFDKLHHKLYYYPRKNEDIIKAIVIAPSLETLIKVEGTIDNPVKNIFFKNISFQHTTWLRPSQKGHVPLQAGMFLLDAYKLKTPGTADKASLENQAWVGRPAAAVEINYANNVNFEACRFEHLGSTALDYNKGITDVLIEGNLFKDVSGGAINMGTFSDEATEAHLPYNPKDERIICTNVIIKNNLITNVTLGDWGTVGINAGYVKSCTIEHNEVNNVSYSGISVGWGWTKSSNAMSNNKIIANKIHHYAKRMYDVAAIYILSAQPNSVIADNYIDSIYKAPYAHIASHWFYLYTDEGTSYYTIKNNWTPSEKFLQNANGPENIWENNGPQVNDSVKQKAGLTSAYKYLLKDNVAADKNYAINKEQPVIIELIAKDSIDKIKLKEILVKAKVKPDALYQWKNHYVIFDKVQDVFSLREKIRSAFPSLEIKTYDNLFYEFNRKYCDDKTIAKEWDHILLTANLVADTNLQREYMNYHATQFEKWPEVAKGFCNAGFQQLLVFRNGRQLMLVISIPKGGNLDKLNPKTTENNPRVDEWNNLMKKYQEGIEGTQKSETWVFLKP